MNTLYHTAGSQSLYQNSSGDWVIPHTMPLLPSNLVEGDHVMVINDGTNVYAPDRVCQVTDRYIILSHGAFMLDTGTDLMSRWRIAAKLEYFGDMPPRVQKETK